MGGRDGGYGGAARREPRYGSRAALVTRPSAAEVEIGDLAATALDRPRFEMIAQRTAPARVDIALQPPGPRTASVQATASALPHASSEPRLDTPTLALVGALSVATGVLLGAWLFWS
jgi:hypothetical protein